jgi:hypothetical protein
VIKALTKKNPNPTTRGGQKNFIPYRNSALTWLLKDSLGGNSKTVMLAAISPSEIHYNETMSTLRYVERAKQIVNTAVVNDGETNPMVLLLRQEINRLRDELFKVDVKFREQEVVWGRRFDAHASKFKDKEKVSSEPLRPLPARSEPLRPLPARTCVHCWLALASTAGSPLRLLPARSEPSHPPPTLLPHTPPPDFLPHTPPHLFSLTPPPPLLPHTPPHLFSAPDSSPFVRAALRGDRDSLRDGEGD